MWKNVSASVGEILCVIPGFRHELDENCALLGCDTESRGNSLPNPIYCLEMSVSSYHYLLRNSPGECSSREMICQMRFDMTLTSRNSAKLNLSTTPKPTLVLNYWAIIISLNVTRL